MSENEYMRAVQYDRYGGADTLHMRRTDRPVPGDDEALIRVEAASLNPFDWKLRNGMLREHIPVNFPVTPGRDGCGTVVGLGKNVSPADSNALAAGQRVSFISSRMQQGSLAEYAAVKARDFVVPAAANLSVAESAALPIVGLSAWNALVDTGNVQPGMRVLVHGGSGGVGSIAIQLARHLGADVHATCRAANAGKVTALGAAAIPYDTTDIVDAIAECDLVFDPIGGEMHEKSCRVLKKGGCVVYLIAKPFEDVSARYGVECRQAVVLNQAANLRHVIDLAARGVIKPVIGREFACEDFAAAFRLLESGNAGGKIVVTMDGRAD